MKVTGLFTAIGKEGRDQLIKEMPSIRSSMVSKIVYMLQYKGFPTTVVSHNAVLRMHRRNAQ